MKKKEKYPIPLIITLMLVGIFSILTSHTTAGNSFLEDISTNETCVGPTFEELNPYKWEVLYINGTYKMSDACSPIGGESYVREPYCDENHWSNWNSRYYRCLDGCSAGECINLSNPATCTDSDSFNKYEKGFVEFNNSIFADECVGNFSVREHRCIDSHGVPTSEVLNCTHAVHTFENGTTVYCTKTCSEDKCVIFNSEDDCAGSWIVIGTNITDSTNLSNITDSTNTEVEDIIKSPSPGVPGSPSSGGSKGGKISSISEIVQSTSSIDPDIRLTESVDGVQASNDNGSFFNPSINKVDVVISPELAVELSKELYEFEHVGEIKVVVYKKVSAYKVNFKMPAKLFAVVNIDANIITLVDLETGEILDVNKPWWSFIASGV
jgi:hypothetical protein|tara:strand:- start:561 stop:1703 length:1143 start_codon:yes stop_codon:yes gene_type:complete